jgi:glutaredoxin
MKPLASTVLLALLATGAQAGQMYRWTDQEGRVHYTDQPPPSTAKSAEMRKLGDKPADQGMPFALQHAIKNYPVTLYNADCGDVCSKATAHLNRRGVPFTDLNAREEGPAEALAKLTGGKREVPVLLVGKQVIRGYEEGAWNSALDAAGYPTTNILPRPTKQAQAPAEPKPAPQAAQPDPQRQ